MAHCTGWILDVSVEQNRAIIWIKTSEGQILKLCDTYKSAFYILPKDESAGAEIFQLLSLQNGVRKVEWTNKLTDLFDPKMKRLICIYPESLFYYKALQRKLEKDQRVAELFNTELSHLQDYLFTKLKIEPTSKVEVEYDKSCLIKIRKVNDVDVLATPPFSILYFEIESSLDNDDIIVEIRARHQERNEEEVLFEGEEVAILKEFRDYVLAKDPDILVSSYQGLERNTIDHLLARMSEYEFNLGRDGDKLTRIQGRVCLDSKSFHSELDIPTLTERARFGFLPLQLASRFGMNRLIDSRNCYELIQRNFVIPASRNNYRYDSIRTLEEIVTKDKGGMIFSPRVGLHENVVVLDYENEYANLIIRHNLSYETVKSPDVDKGLLPLVLEKILNRKICMFESIICIQ